MMSTLFLWSSLGIICLTAAVCTFVQKWKSLKDEDIHIQVDGENVTLEKDSTIAEEKTRITLEWSSIPPVRMRL